MERKIRSRRICVWRTYIFYHPGDLLKWTEGYEILHFFYGEKERKEGELHSGIGHVVRLILQKEKD